MARDNFFNGHDINSIETKFRSLLFDLDNENCQKLLKIIKYNSRTPLDEDDITYEELLELMDPDGQNRRIFTSSRNNDVVDDARTEFRYWIGDARIESARNQYIGRVSVFMQVVTHDDIREIKLDSENEALPLHNRELTIYQLCNELLLGSQSGAYGLFVTDPSLGFQNVTFNNNTQWQGAFFGVSTQSG